MMRELRFYAPLFGTSVCVLVVGMVALAPTNLYAFPWIIESILAGAGAWFASIAASAQTRELGDYLDALPADGRERRTGAIDTGFAALVVVAVVTEVASLWALLRDTRVADLDPVSWLLVFDPIVIASAAYWTVAALARGRNNGSWRAFAALMVAFTFPIVRAWTIRPGEWTERALVLGDLMAIVLAVTLRSRVRRRAARVESERSVPSCAP